MYKYSMFIDGRHTYALFLNHIEAADFLDECHWNGETVTDIYFKEITWQDALHDSDFEWSYRVEMVGNVLLDNPKQYKRWFDMEVAMREKGFF